jgi:RimJ/RimL family protein N-acetyltransferase
VIKLRLVKLKAEDFMSHAEQIPSCYEVGQYADFLANKGTGWAIVEECGASVGLCGIFPVLPGVAECWMIVTDACRNPFFLHRQALKVFKNHMKENNLHRLQAQTQFGDYAGETWLNRLGFQFEGVMRKYRWDGEDVKLWSFTW